MNIKSIVIILTLFIAMLSFKVNAEPTNSVRNMLDTNAPPIPATILGVSSFSPAGQIILGLKSGTPSQIITGVTNGYNILKTQSFTNGFDESILGVYHSGDFGFIDAVTTAATNSLNYGFFLGGIQVKNAAGKTTGIDIVDGGLTISANGNYTLPLVGEVNLQADTGAVVDLSSVTAGAFSQSTITGYKLLYETSDNNISLGITAGIGYSTLFSDGKPYYIGGLTLTDKLKGKHFLGLI